MLGAQPGGDDDQADKPRWVETVSKVLEALKSSGVEPKDYLLSMPYIIAYMMEDQGDDQVKQLYGELAEITLEVKHLFKANPNTSTREDPSNR